MAVLTAAITGAVVVIVFVGLARLFRFAEANPKDMAAEVLPDPV